MGGAGSVQTAEYQSTFCRKCVDGFHFTEEMTQLADLSAMPKITHLVRAIPHNHTRLCLTCRYLQS